MSSNQVEKNAQRLNQVLRELGKSLDKERRVRIRKLLADTYEAMNAQPLDGKRCLALSDEIDATLLELENENLESSIGMTGAEGSKKSSKKKKSAESPKTDDKKKTEERKKRKVKAEKEGKSSEISAQEGQSEKTALSQTVEVDDKPVCPSEQNCLRSFAQTEAITSELKPCYEISHMSSPSESVECAENREDKCPSKGLSDKSNLQSVELAVGSSSDTNASGGKDGAPSSDLKSDADDIGLFDLIHVEVRCLIRIRAVVRPPFIGKFVEFAEAFAESRESRIEAFISVLSPNTEEFGCKTEVEVGYDDDLIPNMPGLDLVLHPKKKKR